MQLLEDLHQPIGYGIPLYCDNQSVSMVENLMFHDRTKHVEVNYHFIREKGTSRRDRDKDESN